MLYCCLIHSCKLNIRNVCTEKKSKGQTVPDVALWEICTVKLSSSIWVDSRDLPVPVNNNYGICIFLTWVVGFPKSWGHLEI